MYNLKMKDNHDISFLDLPYLYVMCYCFICSFQFLVQLKNSLDSKILEYLLNKVVILQDYFLYLQYFQEFKHINHFIEIIFYKIILYFVLFYWNYKFIKLILYHLNIYHFHFYHIILQELNLC